jgi:hypothetical protein
LDSAKIKHRSVTLKPQSGHIRREESRSDQRQPTDPPLWNNVINQELYNERIQKCEDARKNNTEITAEMEAKEWFDL